MTPSTAERLRLLVVIVFASAVAGSLYSITQGPPDVGWLQPATTGATIGGVVSSCIIGFELFIASGLFERGGKRLPLIVAVLLRGAVYGVIIMAALLVFPGLNQPGLRPARSGQAWFEMSCSPSRPRSYLSR